MYIIVHDYSEIYVPFGRIILTGGPIPQIAKLGLLRVWFNEGLVDIDLDSQVVKREIDSFLEPMNVRLRMGIHQREVVTILPMLLSQKWEASSPVRLPPTLT